MHSTKFRIRAIGTGIPENSVSLKPGNSAKVEIDSEFHVFLRSEIKLLTFHAIRPNFSSDRVARVAYMHKN